MNIIYGINQPKSEDFLQKKIKIADFYDSKICKSVHLKKIKWQIKKAFALWCFSLDYNLYENQFFIFNRNI